MKLDFRVRVFPFAKGEDAEDVERVLSKVKLAFRGGRQPGSHDALLRALTDGQRAMLHVATFCGLVELDGVEYYCKQEAASYAFDVYHSLVALGATEYAAILRQIINMIPDRRVWSNTSLRREALRHMPTGQLARWRELEKAMFALSSGPRSPYVRALEYITAHPEQFFLPMAMGLGAHL